MKNIYLIGMPGCGKSTIGAIVAERLSKPLIDMDEYIEKRQNLTIDDIFKYGETYFRDIETLSLKEVSKECGIIVSTGGGIILRQENIFVMKETGMVIFIDISTENILKNSDLSKRPLLKNDKSAIFKLYENRIDLYRKNADFIVDNNLSIDLAVDKIVEIANNERGTL